MNYLMKIGLLLLLGFQVSISKAQTGIKYQGVAVSEDNTLLAQQTINVKLTVIEKDSPLNVVWEENHNTVTNYCGLFEVVLGEGNQVDGVASFDLINWSGMKYLMNVSLDVNLDNNYELLGSNEINAVAYALESPLGLEAAKEGQMLSFDEVTRILEISGAVSSDEINLTRTLELSNDGNTISVLNNDGEVINDIHLDETTFNRRGANFDFPEGQNGEYVFLGTEEYTVPSNKNLYLVNADAEIELKINGVYVEHFATPNMPILTSGQKVKNCKCTALIVDQTNYIVPVVIDFTQIISYTVPEGKVLIIKSGLDNDDPIEIMIDFNEYKFLKPNETRSTIIITIPEGKTFSLLDNQIENTITGYLISAN